MTDTETDTIVTDENGVVHLAFCPACAEKHVWRLLEALAVPFGGLDATDWPARIHAEAPELYAAIEFLLGPLMELNDPQHIADPNDGAAADTGGLVH